MNDQISHVRLYQYCTKMKQCLFEPAHFVICALYLAEADINEAFTKQTFLGNLNKSLVCDDEYAEVPIDPRRQKNNDRQDESSDEPAVKITELESDVPWQCTEQ